MIEVMKAFYSVHYNFGAFSLLLLILIIFLLTKKNYKWSLIFFAMLIAYNVFIYKKTANRSWTIVIPATEDASGYGNSYQEERTYTFSAKKNWTIKTEKGEVLHWCWVESLLDKFANIDFVDRLWGTKQAKQLRKASEQKLDQ